MSTIDKNTDSFLNCFINDKCYQQNSPLTVKQFIGEAKLRGIAIDGEILESLEKQGLLNPILRLERPIGVETRIKFLKDGKEFYRRKDIGLKDGEELIEEYKISFYSSYGFSKQYSKLLVNWLEEGNLYSPENKGYEKWDRFIGKELEYERNKVITFYSNFQIYWLEILVSNLTINIDLLKESPALSASKIVEIGRRGNKGIYSFQKIDMLQEALTKVSNNDKWSDFFNIAEKKESIRKQYNEFNKFLKFLLLIQHVYYPYARSGSKTIQLRGGDESWKKSKRNFCSKRTFEISGINLDDVLFWYKVFSEKTEDILGDSSNDWMQLWKNISWNKKNRLKGCQRLGVDYLQWALMLKRFIEDNINKEIPDIDELNSYNHEDILNTELNRWNGRFNPRHYRNLRYFDFTPEQYDKLNVVIQEMQNGAEKSAIKKLFKPYEKLGFYINWKKKGIYFDEKELKLKNYYKDKYKKLYYLANSFGLDYQPKMIVFVEGDSEEIVIPEMLLWYGGSPEDLGIDFINICGVDSWLGGSFNLREQFDKKPKKKLISNFKALLTYNLKRWQIIPFLLADNEGNLIELIGNENGEVLSLNGEDIAFSKSSELVYVWGQDNKDTPFKGKSFELANYSDEEISEALSNILSRVKSKQIKIEPKDVNEIRDNHGINEICNSQYRDDIKRSKIQINQRLFQNLKGAFENKEISNEVFERPIFKAFEIIIRNASLNHQPVDRISELKNRNILKEIIQDS